jgi:hypothetical protein
MAVHGDSATLNAETKRFREWKRPRPTWAAPFPGFGAGACRNGHNATPSRNARYHGVDVTKPEGAGKNGSKNRAKRPAS